MDWDIVYLQGAPGASAGVRASPEAAGFVGAKRGCVAGTTLFTEYGNWFILLNLIYNNPVLALLEALAGADTNGYI